MPNGLSGGCGCARSDSLLALLLSLLKCCKKVNLVVTENFLPACFLDLNEQFFFPAFWLSQCSRKTKLERKGNALSYH